MKYLSFPNGWVSKEPGGSKPDEQTEPRKTVWVLQVEKIHIKIPYGWQNEERNTEDLSQLSVKHK